MIASLPKKHAMVRIPSVDKVYRAPKPGPEAVMLPAIARWMAESGDRPWVAHSMSVGSGAPDLLAVEFREELLRLSPTGTDPLTPWMLTYLRSVRWVSARAVSSRLRVPPSQATELLEELHGVGAVDYRAGTWRLCPEWRSILPSVTTVEAKVNSISGVVSQGCRNALFATRSYVALPPEVAGRVVNHPDCVAHGIGVLAVQGEDVRVVRRARRVRRHPSLPYYFTIAVKTREALGGTNAVHHSH